MRERELKRVTGLTITDCDKSLPMRERELKLKLTNTLQPEISRSPCGSVN